MKKITLLLLAAATTAVCTAQGKFDAGGLMVMDSYKTLQRDPMMSAVVFENLPVSIATVQGRSDAKVSVFVTLNPGAKASDLEARGFEILADMDELVLASGTLGDIEKLGTSDLVKNISFGEKRDALLDRSRIATGVDQIHAGTGLSQAYKGAGVITGIYDTGLDPNHINFLDSEFNPRFGVLWNFTSSSGSYKTYSNAEAIKTFVTDNATATHGTHTLGCMAGSYNGSEVRVAIIDDETKEVTVSRVIPPRKFPNPYYGMAPEATIAAGCGELYDANISLAIKNVAEYAKAQGKPAVMNLSLGSPIGPHDGSDAVAKVIEKYGRDMVIFISSSNSGDANMSLDKTFNAGDTEVATLISAPGNYSGTLDIWSSSSETFSFTPIVYDLNTKSVIFEHTIDGSKEGSTFIASSNVSVPNKVTGAGFDAAFTSSSLTITASKNQNSNNRYNVRVNLSARNSNANSDHSKVLGFRIEGKAGQRIMATTNATSRVDDYDYSVEFSSMEQPGYTNGSPDFSVNSMACGKNVVVVGAWNARNTWPTLLGVYQDYSTSGDGWDVGDAAGFSSYGTMLDGTTRPHVCAPGSAIISSISTPYMSRLSNLYGSDFANYVNGTQSADQNVNGRHNYWEAQQGTSMSSPICAGGVALWLQADPTLIVDDVLQILAETSDKDDFVTNGRYPAAKWGAGKFNALAGLRKVLGMSGGVNAAISDEQRLIISQNGDAIEAFVAGETGLRAVLHNMNGMLAAQAEASGNSVTVDTSALTPGIYVMTVSGDGAAYTRKVVVK